MTYVLDKVFVYSIFCLGFVYPLTGVGQQYPFQNVNLSFEKRAEDLVGRLTLEEKVSLMQDVSQPVTRLGIQSYNWWNEALHGVARSGLATVFPQPIGMAATFDEELIQEVFTAVSDEARAKNTLYVNAGKFGRYQGLTMWTPTINILRDPRWGRGIETYGEDPFLTSLLGVAAVKGLQGPTELSKYDKLHACAKHFAVHSGPEWNRHSFDAKLIKPRDLYETYLPAFEALVKDGNVREVMCAYKRFEGEPCCSSDQLLMQILRERWGFDGIVVADCGAIADFYKENAHHTHENAAKASADAVRSGTDLDCGSSYKDLVAAVAQGDIGEADIDISVKRLLLARFRLGEMDDIETVSWAKINPNVIASEKHHALALDVARKSITLLQNSNNVLPLKRGGLTVAVMGPNANDSVMQWGNYNGTPAHTITILEGIKSALGENDKIIYEPVSGLVERSLFRSAFDRCRLGNTQGVLAQYWNNIERKGEVVVEQQLSSAFALCTSGATVFAPGVALTDFSARYSTVFYPDTAGKATLELYVNGKADIKIDGEIVRSIRTGHGARKIAYSFVVEKGKSYPVEVDFIYHSGDAQLNMDIGFKEDVNFEESLQRVKGADVIIYVGGISPSVEGEEMGVDLPGFKRGDRTDIRLPDVQQDFLRILGKQEKPVVYVNCSGSAIGLGEVMEICPAILQAWYPGQAGGQAVAEVLFGDHNPSGRLPITFYRDVFQLPDFENYDMEGRTYRYFRDKPLFAFGYGLSFSCFTYDKPVLTKANLHIGDSTTLTVPVKNVSLKDGEEIVQLYVKRNDDDEGPIRTLRAVRRVFIPAGETVYVSFTVGMKELEWWSDTYQTMAPESGSFTLEIGRSSREEDLKKVQLQLL